ncbi:alpha/beta hydrolase [Streptomyces cocklensis]|uniref:Esterase n=1 Tax=Actinacidiphila cocklensis TaxID=887465 RepID=A0A9W4DVL5_9ACTN|nr:alpha/beta hydrolase [Actinacidiphila cocklensis]MDD1059874.1 alpha/beta hydrolase [Actinacidiphila cocklensis]WSX72741.1 alpha/beta hydrolase [Streptomyces sp. NBC_00899]WSX81191.1 alpha/beta hydrolase [Streptomyces sp. NBC_00899]CAG6397175.1 Esterase [Actinacidiphila cocklensis]
MQSDSCDGAGEPSPCGIVLDPAVERLVTALAAPPFLDELGPVLGRQALRESQADRIDDFDMDAAFRVAPVGPSGLVGFWIFRPRGTTGPLPALFYVHGGRWMLGDAQTHVRLISEFVRELGTMAIVPEYSRTPEARYPVALEECYALLAWTAAHADELQLDPERLAVAGDCAGATLATALTMLARRRGGPSIRAQVLYYPLTDSRCDSESQRRFATGYLLTREALRGYWEQYAAKPRQMRLPTASPLRATRAELAGLPPALVVTAEADVARDEGEEYARRLRAAGVEASAMRFLGTIHDFVSLAALRDSPPTRAAVRQGCDFLCAKLLNEPS